MRPQKPVQNNLQDFNIDYDESQVHQDVQYTGDGTHHHFRLSQSDTEHIFPTLFNLVIGSYRFSQFNIPIYFFYVFYKKRNTDNKKYRKYNIGKVGHSLVGYIFRGVIGRNGIIYLFLSKYGNVNVAFWV